MKEQIYYFNDPDKKEPVSISRQEILDYYWEFWKEQMTRKYGENHYLITEQNCIDDWMITHYAWEKTQ